MTAQDMWSNVHNNYGADLGCSSDEDYVKPGENLFRFLPLNFRN